jgi:LemA protein
MQGWLIGVIVVGVIAVIVVMVVIGIYNNLVTLRERFRNAFAQIEVQLKRRHDLIPNLVETVKGYMGHERGTLEAVIAARNQAVTGLSAAAANPGDANAMKQLAASEGALMGAMGRLMVVAEAYPDLKASANMAQLTEELSSTENRVAFSRQAYNDSVTAYNVYRQSFPPILFAGLFGHGSNATRMEFEDTAAIQQAPKVSFS